MDDPGTHQNTKHRIIAACCSKAKLVETRINTVQQVSSPLTGYRQRIGNAACYRWGV